MKYPIYRGEIQTGDLLVWSHRGWGTWYDLQVQAVRLFTRSEYCHVGVAWRCAGRVFVIEAVAPYVRIVPLSNLLPCYVFKMPKGISPAALERGLSLVGKAKYSKVEAILSYFGQNKDSDAWQCVEFVKDLYKFDGMEFTSKDTPSEFVLECQEKYSTQTTYIE